MGSGQTPRTQVFTNPLPDVVLGDPFVLRHRGWFYLYGTNDGPPLADGRVIPVHRSDDLIHWEPLGGALVPSEPEADHWAPEVMYWNGRFFMVVSFGDVDRRGHALWVATADRPEGPFRLANRLSDPSELFSIDGSWLLDDDGQLYLFRCLDFTEAEEPPHGTGIAVQPMHDPQTTAGPPATVLRAHSPWQLFQAGRTMPLYGGRTFATWNTIEGPAPVRRAGRVFCGYSGGNYTGAYGTGEAIADHPLGPYTDLRGENGPIFGTTPGLVEGPGHFSIIRPDLVHDWIVLHGRTPGEHVRRVWLCPASWDRDGVTIGPLTDAPQPAPPLPTDLSRFDGPPGSSLEGWRIDSGTWTCGGDGLRQADRSAAESLACREAVTLGDSWAADVWIRFPEAGPAEAGLIVLAEGARAKVVIRPGESRWEATGPDGAKLSHPLPTLGAGPFDPKAYHVLEIRAESGRAEALLDGVRLPGAWSVAGPDARLGLIASGVADFDALAITKSSGSGRS